MHQPFGGDLGLGRADGQDAEAQGMVGQQMVPGVGEMEQQHRPQIVRRDNRPELPVDGRLAVHGHREGVVC